MLVGFYFGETHVTRCTPVVPVGESESDRLFKAGERLRSPARVAGAFGRRYSHRRPSQWKHGHGRHRRPYVDLDGATTAAAREHATALQGHALFV